MAPGWAAPDLMVIADGYLFDFPREYLRPALVVSLLSVGVLVGLFFYLNAFTRRRYFTIWSAAWLFYALWLTLSLGMQEVGPSPGLLMLKQWCVGISAVFLLWGAASFLKQPIPERVFGLFLGFLLVWGFLGAFGGGDARWSQWAVFATLGLGGGVTAYGFCVFRRRLRYMGATLLAAGFALWGAYIALYPLWQGSEHLIAAGFLVSAVLQLFIAVSMIILVLEEARTSNERALQQIERQKSETEGLRTRVLSTEERYRTLFAQASEPIIITTTDNLRILELNPAARRLLGLGQNDGAGERLTGFLRWPGLAPQTGAEWHAALLEQPRVEVVRADGTAVPAEIAGAAVELDGSTGCQFFLREITERTRLEQQLRQAEKLSALGRMISGIAHELNNPLAVIKGYLDLVLRRRDLGELTRADLEKVAHESDRAAHLVSNFLSFARERPPCRHEVDLNQLVKKVLDLREMDLRVTGTQAALCLDPALPRTEADPAQIEQVIVNLVSNALHALAEWPGSRRLRISTGAKDGRIVLRVHDSGPGVPAHVLPHIFEPFFTTKPVGSGTGLGLSIAHSTIAAHNGRIFCEASPEGGAAFVVELPVVRKDSPKEVAAAPSEEWVEPAQELCGAGTGCDTASQGIGARVLIVDDERTLSELLAELLSALGHVPVTCGSALQALELLQEQPFDLILSDFRMPQMNGRQFYEQLRESHPHLSGRVIFVTGDVVTEETRAFLDAAGTPHLSKPFRLGAVEAAVTKVLQGEERAEEVACA